MSNRPAGAADELKSRMQADLRSAMKAGRSSEVKVVRLLIAAIDNAEAPPLSGDDQRAKQHDFQSGSAETSRLSLDSSRLQQVIGQEIDEREQSADDLDRAGRPDAARMLRAEISIIARYLQGVRDG